jgi:hypothetical protein
MLAGEMITADLESILARLGVEAAAPRLGDLEDDARLHATCANIGALLDRAPAFSGRFDYGWAREPAFYTATQEAWLQLELLSVLTALEADHPALGVHRPTVVRLVATPGLDSTFARGTCCDYVLLAAAHFSLVRELAVLICAIHAWWVEDSEGSPTLDENWIETAMLRLLARPAGALDAVFTPLQRHIVSLSVGKTPVSPRPLDAWIANEAASGNKLALEVGAIYQGVDRFVLLHELAHALEGHTDSGRRDLATELGADRGAISLLVLRVATAPESPDWVGAPPVTGGELVFGPVTYLHLLRLVQLFVGAYRAAALMTDMSAASGDRILHTTRLGLAELDARLVHVITTVLEFGLDELAPLIERRMAALNLLFVASAVKLLADVGIENTTSSLLRILNFDTRAAMERLREALPTEE